MKILYYVNTETEEGFYESFWTQGVLVNMEKIDWVLTQETKKNRRSISVIKRRQ